MRVLLLLGIIPLGACIDFRDGLACATDSDCLDYACLSGRCVAPAPPSGGGGGGGTGGGGGGSNELTVIASGQTNASNLRQDVTTLYWLVQSGGNLKVRKAVKSGAGAVEVADLGPITASTKPAMAVDAQDLFVAAGQKVFKVSKTGGTPSVVATSTGGQYGGGIGIAGTTLVWLSPGDSATVWAQPLSGGTPAPIASNELLAEELIAAEESPYWAVRDGIVLSNASGGSRARFETQGLRPRGLAASGNTVMWLQGSFEYRTVTWTTHGAPTASTLQVDRDLRAVTFDGTRTIYGVGEDKDNRGSTSLVAVNTDDLKVTVTRATGGSGVTGGVASEIQVDASNVYFIVHDQISRRAR